MNEQVHWMQQMIIPWLTNENWDKEKLINWLQGYDLPSVGYDEEPYVWLLHGLPPGGDERYALEATFAHRVGALLSCKPDVIRPGKRPAELLYNLLMLAAGLSSPDQLAEPLFEMFERAVLAGAWLGTNLCTFLCTALAENQLDNRLQPVWRMMLKGKPHPFLGGTVYDGFEGVLLMPQSTETRGEPSLNEIGAALKAIVWFIEKEKLPKSDFLYVLNRTIQQYPGRLRKIIPMT